MNMLLTLYICTGILIAGHYAGGAAYMIVKSGRTPVVGLLYGIESEPLPYSVIAVVLVVVLLPQVAIDIAAWPLTVAWRLLRGRV